MTNNKQIIFTADGPIHAATPAALEASIKRIPCIGNACENIQDKISGRIVVLRNNSSDTITGKVVWGSVFGTCDYASNYTLFPGETENFPFPNPGILGVCNITADLY